MSDRALDGHEAQTDVIETRMGSHVEDIMSAARKAAAQLQAEVERASTERAAQIETVAARRAHAVRMGAESEAERLQAHTRAATQQYVAASRRLVDEFAKERMRRIADIGDRLAAQAEALVERLAGTDEVARQLGELRVALGAAGELIAVEAGRGSPDLPELPSLHAIAGATTKADTAQDAVEETEPVGSQTPQEGLASATGRPLILATPTNEPPADPGSEEPTDDA